MRVVKAAHRDTYVSMYAHVAHNAVYTINNTL